MTKKERETLKKYGFKAHEYSDGYTELEKWGITLEAIISYDAKENTLIEGLTEAYKYIEGKDTKDHAEYRELIKNLIDELKKIK